MAIIGEASVLKGESSGGQVQVHQSRGGGHISAIFSAMGNDIFCPFNKLPRNKTVQTLLTKHKAFKMPLERRWSQNGNKLTQSGKTSVFAAVPQLPAQPQGMELPCLPRHYQLPPINHDVLEDTEAVSQN